MEQEPGKDGVTVSGVNLGELAKPATTLIEKISEAIGGIARPWQIVRVARAESVAKRIEAEAQIEVSEIQQRALRRFLSEEEQKQKNIESITEKAIPLLADKSNPDGMDRDWIADFFDKCRIVSDDEMQLLWSKVLAGEANEPNSYSKRTVALLGSLSKEEAELFTLFGSFLWSGAKGAHFVIEGDAVEARFLKESRHHYISAQSHLQDIGLLASNTLHFPAASLAQREFRYFHERFQFKLPTGYRKPAIDPTLPITYLSGAGEELLSIAGSKPLEGYAPAVMQESVKMVKMDFEHVGTES